MKKLDLVSTQIHLLSITSFYFLLKLPTNQTFYSYKHKKKSLNCLQMFRRRQRVTLMFDDVILLYLLY